MRPQHHEATKQELVALNEFLFCLRLFDYLGGKRGWDFSHISNPNLVRERHRHTHTHTQLVSTCDCACVK